MGKEEERMAGRNLEAFLKSQQRLRTMIVGLGNHAIPHSRTSVGMFLLDRFAESQGLSWRTEPELYADVAREKELIIAKVRTYLEWNNGHAVQRLVREYSVSPEKILVIYPDLNIPLGGYALWTPVDGKRDVEYSGISSAEQHLGSTSFARLGIGLKNRTAGFLPTYSTMFLAHPTQIRDSFLNNKISEEELAVFKAARMDHKIHESISTMLKLTPKEAMSAEEMLERVSSMMQDQKEQGSSALNIEFEDKGISFLDFSKAKKDSASAKEEATAEEALADDIEEASKDVLRPLPDSDVSDDEEIELDEMKELLKGLGMDNAESMKELEAFIELEKPKLAETETETETEDSEFDSSDEEYEYETITSDEDEDDGRHKR